jgi:hypothetical protein
MAKDTGASKNRRSALIRKRNRLQTLLPLLSTEKARDVRYELQKLNAKLGPQKAAFAKPQADLTASAAGVNGVGGLMFQAQSPPGAGRLVRVPFYLYDANFTQLAFQAPEVGPMVFTGAGSNQLDEANPTINVTMPNDPSGRRVLSGFQFRTPVVDWARLRVVGLETCQIQSVYGGRAPANQILGPSPLPSSPVPVDGYDVGPGSGATGRYNPYAVVPVPVPPPPQPRIALPDPPGGVPAIIWQQGPGFDVNQIQIDFGVIALGETATAQITFTDVAGAPQARNFAGKASTAPEFTDDAPNVVTANWVPAGGTATVTVTFTPTAVGTVTGVLSYDFSIGGNPPACRVFITVVGTAAQNRYYNNGKLYLLLKNLSVGGGANLLSQEGYIDGALYDSRLRHNPGLRAMPTLNSPNRAYIEAAVVGPQLTSMTFSVNLLCDIMDDTEYGVVTPGPYARREALLRSSVSNPNSDVR